MVTPMTRPVQVHDRGGSKSVIVNRDRPIGRKRNVPELCACTGPGGVTRAREMCGAQCGHDSTSANADHAWSLATGTSKDRSTSTAPGGSDPIHRPPVPPV